MACEDGGVYDDEEFEVEETTEPTSTDLLTPSPTLAKPAAGLTGLAKKKENKKRRGPVTPLTPTPQVLEKAAQSIPINQRWTGLAKPLEHPLLAHANDAEFLKTRMQFADWQGEHTHVILDRKQHVIGVLVAPPQPGQDWNAVVAAATAAVREARDKMTFPTAACQHRRASGDGFPRRGLWNAAAMEELLGDPNVARMATYPIHSFSKNPRLHRTFPRSPFTTVTVNLGPVSVSPPHTDFANKADGMCLIGALGRFDPDKGGHLVLWDYDLIAGEERFSLIQYCAGRSFPLGGEQVFRPNLSWRASATAEDVVNREEECKMRCAHALKKFTRWKDVKVRNYSGKARLDVCHTGDVEDFSDYTEDESEEERRPAKKARLYGP
ncbi:hypothetical protein B0H14DRAFT_3442550 [Mycena olivaceomarginata]|nr:hypothetical protein B0H14DRAFT_3442550 [Mycena olivaceomarginata]